MATPHPEAWASEAKLDVAVLRLKDGTEAWRYSVRDYPRRDVPVELKPGRDSIIVSGPDVVALSPKGELLWRTPFPEANSTAAAATRLGTDLFLLDGESIMRVGDRGLPVWRAAVGGRIRGLTEYGPMLLGLASTETAGDEVVAFDLETSLGGPARSPLCTEDGRTYVTTLSALLVLEAETGAVRYRSGIAPALQSRDLLPDRLVLEDQRVAFGDFRGWYPSAAPSPARSTAAGGASRRRAAQVRRGAGVVLRGP